MFRKIALFIGMPLVIVCLSGKAFAQQDSDRQKIAGLIDSFSEAATSRGSLAEFFSPNARATQAKDLKALNEQAFHQFTITDFVPKDIDFESPQNASVHVKVTWATSNESIVKTTTLHFVNVGGNWFFADAGFWRGISLLWFSPFILYGIGYGVGITIMLAHIHRVHWADSRKRFQWEVLTLVPGTLPLYFSGRPWLEGQEKPKETKPGLAHS